MGMSDAGNGQYNNPVIFGDFPDPDVIRIDELMAAGWKMNFVRMHMDPYRSNIPGVSTTGENDISAFNFNRFSIWRPSKTKRRPTTTIHS